MLNTDSTIATRQGIKPPEHHNCLGHLGGGGARRGFRHRTPVLLKAARKLCSSHCTSTCAPSEQGINAPPFRTLPLALVPSHGGPRAARSSLPAWPAQMPPPGPTAEQDVSPKPCPAAGAGRGQDHAASAGHKDHRHWEERSLEYGVVASGHQFTAYSKCQVLSIPQQSAFSTQRNV